MNIFVKPRTHSTVDPHLRDCINLTAKPHIVIGCPVRDRAQLLPYYLAGLDRLTYPNVSYLFLENGPSRDATYDILFDYLQTRPGLLTRTDITDNGLRRDRNYENWARMYNCFYDTFLNMTDGDYLFALDSDTIVPPDTLERLLSLDLPYVSVLVDVSRGRDTAWNVMWKRADSNQFYRTPDKPSGLVKCDWTGGAMLIRRNVLEAGVRCWGHCQGEGVGFCLNMLDKGFQPYCYADIEAIHLMTEEQLERERDRDRLPTLDDDD